MKTLETLPNAEIIAFPSESDLQTYCQQNPTVRHVARVVRQKSAKGEVIGLFCTYSNSNDARQATVNAFTADEQARRKYVRSYKHLPLTHGDDWELEMRRRGIKYGYNAEELEVFVATMRKEKFGTRSAAEQI